MSQLKTDRPALLRLINSFAKLFQLGGIVKQKINADKLVQHAIKHSKLSNFGDDAVLQGLQEFCHALNTEANLSPYGQLMTKKQLAHILDSRLQIVHWCSQHPYIYKNSVTAPLIIVGMPRSGANSLFRLLAQDRELRAPLSWETHMPFPPPRVGKAHNDPRITKTDIHYALMHRLAPSLHTLHAHAASMAQECTEIDAYSMQSFAWCDAFSTPSYRHWLETRPYKETLKFHKLFLQYLQSDFNENRWLLSSSHHLQALDDLLAVYPDALVVHVHRQPMDALLSACSYKFHLRGLYANKVNAEAIGREQLEYWVRTLKKASRARSQLAERDVEQQQFIDVQFDDIRKKPLQTVEQIYSHFNLKLSTASRNRMQSFLSEAPAHKTETSNYQLDDFGLDKERDGERFKAYCEAFNIR